MCFLGEYFNTKVSVGTVLCSSPLPLPPSPFSVPCLSFHVVVTSLNQSLFLGTYPAFIKLILIEDMIAFYFLFFYFIKDMIAVCFIFLLNKC